MHPILKNILAVIFGWIGGSAVNIGILFLGLELIPVEGLAEDMSNLSELMPNFTFKNFIFPFLAHALGTLAGAAIAAKIAANNPMIFAYVIGVFFLIGGITAVVQYNGPLNFNIIDLLIAYLPMSYLGGKLATSTKGKTLL